MFLKVINKLLQPTHTGMQFWQFSKSGDEKASYKSTTLLPLAQETWQLSPSNLAALLRVRCTSYGILLLLPPNALQEDGDMCVTVRQEDLQVDPKTIKKPWVDIAAKDLIKNKLGMASKYKLKVWKNWCKQLPKHVGGELKPLLPALLDMCKAAYKRAVTPPQ